jgi:magnesium-protoporphyrin O-methyltransferase
MFNEKAVVRELADYRARGPAGTTRLLVDALSAEGVRGLTLLDIGGGVGAIQHALLETGAATAEAVDASRAYLQAARSEAQHRGLAERISYHHGDFVAIADQIPPADVVTLDRVLCCYHDVEGLVSASAAHARRLYGLVYPRDRWWIRLGIRLLNLVYRLQKTPFRTFVHNPQAVEALLSRQGFSRRFYRETLLWQVVVYGR